MTSLSGPPQNRHGTFSPRTLPRRKPFQTPPERIARSSALSLSLTSENLEAGHSVLLLCQTRRSTMRLCQCHWSINCAPCGRSLGSQTPGDPATPGSPRRRRTLHRRGLEKQALNSGITRRSAKMTQNAPKNPFIEPLRKATCLCCELGCPPKQAMKWF